MYRTIKRIIKACDLCQKAKISNITARGPTQSIISEKTREIISVDLMVANSLLDIFSKYIKLYPLKRATTNTIIKSIVSDYIPIIGTFNKILTDNGTQFTSHKWI